jgi:hypothetical protein
MDRPQNLILWLVAAFLLLGAAAHPAEFVGIPDEDFVAHYRPQRASMWCWASCIEMALSYEGIELPQETIVTRALGDQVNLGGLPEDLVRSMNGKFRTASGASVLVSGRFVRGAPTSTVLYNQLQRKQPVILLYKGSLPNGHAVVLTGIEVEGDSSRGLVVARMHVFDPFLGDGRAAGEALVDWSLDGDVEILKVYEPTMTRSGARIPPGAIDGIVLVDSRVLPPTSGEIALADHGQGHRPLPASRTVPGGSGQGAVSGKVGSPAPRPSLASTATQ